MIKKKYTIGILVIFCFFVLDAITSANIDGDKSWHPLNQVLRTGSDSDGIQPSDSVDANSNGIIDSADNCNADNTCEINNADISGTLSVGSTATMTDADVSGSLDVTSTATMTDATVSGDLGVTGSANVDGDLQVGGTATLSSADVNGNLDVSGSATLDSATVSNDLTVSNSVTAGAFYYSSDERLKTDIRPLELPMDKLNQIRGVRFTWKDSNKASIGLIAQNVEKVYPELVKTNPKTGMKAVQYGNIVAVLVEAVKSRQKEIDELKKQVEILKNMQNE